jgi:hypothetical protein
MATSRLRTRLRRPYEHVNIAFPGRVTIDNVYDATLVKGLVTIQSVTAELGPKATAKNDFVVMGSGTTSLNPTFTCYGASAPPPAPPHADDCPLLLKYVIRNAWDGGEIIALKLKAWAPGRPFTITYWGQQVSLSSPQGATITSADIDSKGNTVARLKLGPAPADASVEAVFQISPPARLLPHVVCHLPWPPPPLPPPPLPPPKPPPSPPPPPPPHVAHASEPCRLGGSATTLAIFGSSAVRVDVRLDQWIAGDVVTLGIGDGGDEDAQFAVTLPRAVHATPAPRTSTPRPLSFMCH